MLTIQGNVNKFREFRKIINSRTGQTDIQTDVERSLEHTYAKIIKSETILMALILP